MRFCCRAFEHHSGNVGKRGWSVYATKGFDRPHFNIEFLGIDNEQQDALGKELGKLPPNKTGLGFALGSDLVIDFCPWCGRRLGRIYRKNWEELLSTEGLASRDD